MQKGEGGIGDLAFKTDGQGRCHGFDHIGDGGALRKHGGDDLACQGGQNIRFNPASQAVGQYDNQLSVLFGNIHLIAAEFLSRFI
ncbi:hypothetical protein SDC9_127988 [bioreactor metagenome]|uniref:Uncharacterized protein n=1 Tax=bioreactor metagenome TaxID=1076179 RepID=A0A645CVJ5_9ZZZZ